MHVDENFETCTTAVFYYLLKYTANVRGVYLLKTSIILVKPTNETELPMYKTYVSICILKECYTDIIWCTKHDCRLRIFFSV